MKTLAKCGRCRKWFWSEPPAQLCSTCNPGAAVIEERIRLAFGPTRFETNLVLEPVMLEPCPFCPGDCQCERKDNPNVVTV